MINVKDYLAKQLSGPRLLTVIQGISAAFNRFWNYLQYLSSISIDLAEETELANIGIAMGYPWPLVPNAVILDKVFTYSAIAGGITFSDTGFSSLDGVIDGGNFSTLNVLSSNKMPISQYRKLLKAIAKIKWGSFSFISIDIVCQVFHPNYDIEYYNTDFLVKYKHGDSSISNTSLYLANRIFSELFNASPHVTVTRIS